MDEARVEKRLISDRELIERVLKGEHGEYRHLVVRYQNLLYSMIMKQLADPEVAKELTQDCFLKAFKNLRSFRFESAFSSWLVRIALNTTNSYFASRRYKERLQTEPITKYDLATLQLPAEEEPYTDQAVQKLRLALGALKPKYRDVVVLHYFEKRPYREIATLLHIPEGTVGSRLHTALSQLRKRLRHL